MNELKFNSQFCTNLKQSQRLLELGLKPETADMVHMQIDGSWICIISQGDEEYIPYEDFFLAWSLHRLLLLCDVTAMFTRDTLETAYDDKINVIEILIKNGYFNKEYLKQ
jgi:hypothetical protein